MGKRSPDSLAARILAFYAANPDEELSYPDMAVKFGVSEDKARWTMRVLLCERPPVLESVHVIRTRRKGAGL